MRRLLIRRSTQDASISVLCAKLRLSFVSDEVAGGVEPLGTLLALDDELTFVVRRRTRRALTQRGAWTAKGAVGLVSPVGVETRLVGPANLTDGAPLAFPISLRYVIQRRFHAVNVIGNVALVAQEETGLVVTIATSFAHRTVKTSPSFWPNDFSYLDVGTERMIALEMAERE
jgi:hypothetical protein